MTRKLFQASLLVSFSLAIASAASAADWATLKGRFVYDGTAPKTATIEPTKDQEVCGKHKLYDESLVVDDKGGIANAVIMLKTKKVPVAPEYASTADAKVELDNKNCRFEPHVALMRTSQTLVLKNSDPAPVSHNTNISPLKNAGINPVLAAGGDPLEQKFGEEEALPIKIGCNIHPWMGAWLIVRDDPYAAVSDKTGEFTIKDLPAGTELEFVFWQEKAGYLKNAAFKGGKSDTKGRFKIKLKPGENSLGDIKVPAGDFKK